MKSLKDKMFKNFSKEEISNYGSIVGGKDTYTTTSSWTTYVWLVPRTDTSSKEDTRSGGRDGDADKNGSQYEHEVGHF